MKSKDLQKLVLSKYENGEGPSKIFRHLNGVLCLRTVKRWCKMIRETGSIELSTSPGRSPTIRTKESIKKVKHRLNRKKKVTSRKLAVELNISRTSVRHCNDKKVECVDVVMMFIDKLGRAVYRHPR